MTVIELFPWLLAVCIAVLVGVFSARAGLPGVWVWAIALISAILSWSLYWVVLGKLASLFQKRLVNREKAEIEKRRYQVFDSAKDRPAGKNLFYECVVCGDVVQSMPKQNVSCKCRNILIDATSGRIEIANHTKVKLFSCWKGMIDCY